MVLLRAFARLVEVALMLVLALLGLGLAMYCLDAFIHLGDARPDRLLDLPQVRHDVGHFLDQVAAPGSTAALALLCGLGAMVLGVLLLIGLLGSRRPRLLPLEQDDNGALAARPGPIRDMARALAAQAAGATAVKRPRLKLPRGRRRGRMTVSATRSRTESEGDVQRAVSERIDPLTEPFRLRQRVHVRRGEHGERVQ
jgi:hypothetical protein